MRGFTVVVVVLVVLGLVLLAGGAWAISGYNSLVRLNEGVDASWSQVQNQYQRRMDLIPNLVETVKGVASFERETFTAVAEARAKAGQVTLSPELARDPQAFRQFEQSQGELSSALSRLLVAVERYPELKAGTNFSQLQDELAGTENRISVERKRFNDTVLDYNRTLRQFPRNVIAGIFNFDARPYFQSQAGAEQAPRVDFGTGRQ